MVGTLPGNTSAYQGRGVRGLYELRVDPDATPGQVQAAAALAADYLAATPDAKEHLTGWVRDCIENSLAIVNAPEPFDFHRMIDKIRADSQ
ncbi:hypothetical protein LEM8419_03553 [Neolewinella maritima]|uniref:Uncharacterized protein n=1 Tax=Neolewinella maritima TaxID=1383882 RepID=A0ABM9B5Q1_9BACT|nr:hypothetical protein [Neolewinella maritima]CAH1002681.1 hypothetical protein LEM8419_03553 [Neolewinella maritima]